MSDSDKNYNSNKLADIKKEKKINKIIFKLILVKVEITNYFIL
jgi:hypothetical protein